MSNKQKSTAMEFSGFFKWEKKKPNNNKKTIVHMSLTLEMCVEHFCFYMPVRK